jgi:hypothetical protein
MSVNLNSITKPAQTNPDLYQRHLADLRTAYQNARKAFMIQAELKDFSEIGEARYWSAARRVNTLRSALVELEALLK